MRLIGTATRAPETRIVNLKEARRDGKTQMAVHELDVIDSDSGRLIRLQRWTDVDEESPFGGYDRGSDVDARIGAVSTYGDSVRAEVLDKTA